MNIRLNKAHYPVTVLGPGRRVGFWLQGCSVGCPNCVSKDTWAADDSKTMPIAQLLSWARSISKGALDGVTISGGEPFDQPAALARLLDGLAEWRAAENLNFDILCYSGRPWRFVKKHFPEILEKIDAIIPEPFVASLAPGYIWRGSSNQPLLPLTERGTRVYGSFLDCSETPGFQAVAAGGQIWFIGIPSTAGMDHIEELCARKGIELQGVSW